MKILKNLSDSIYPYQRDEDDIMSHFTKKIYNNNLCKEIVDTGFAYTPYIPNSLKRYMPKYKFTRDQWYVADYDWVHQSEVFEWCNKQFGPHPIRPDAWSRWYNKYSEKMHFRDEKDYQWFLLRWSV